MMSVLREGYQPEELKGIANGRNTDWQDLLYKNSYRTDHNITIAGGQAGNTFSLGGGYYKETTVLPGEDYTRYSLRATIDSRVGKRIKVGINSQNSVLANMAKRFANPVFYPAVGDFYHCVLKKSDPFVVIEAENEQEVTTKLVGHRMPMPKSKPMMPVAVKRMPPFIACGASNLPPKPLRHRVTIGRWLIV